MKNVFTRGSLIVAAAAFALVATGCASKTAPADNSKAELNGDNGTFVSAKDRVGCKHKRK